MNAELFVAREASGEQLQSILAFLVSINVPLILLVILMQVMEKAEVGWIAQAGALAAVYAPVLAIYEARFSMLRMVRQNG